MVSKKRNIQIPLPGAVKEYEAYYQADGKWDALIVEAGRKFLWFYIKEPWKPLFDDHVALPWAASGCKAEARYFRLRFRGIVSGVMRCGYKNHFRRRVQVTMILEARQVSKEDLPPVVS